ncbi:MAG: L-rhamnose isomerase [Clostridiales bacterium]|nr:L-rhamnose isomerase [Clostridiales bacterium]
MDIKYVKDSYGKLGIDVDAAVKKVGDIPISIHCWQGDDVIGFDGSGSLGDGLATTGNYPGRARNFEELKEDIKFAFSLIPGKKRLNLHACYAVLGADKGKVDRDKYTYKYFEPWVKFAKELGLDGIDFNPTFFSHKMMKNGLSLSSPDEKVRKFWVEHGKACLKITEYIATEMGTPSLMNIWVPDGMKDVPADRLTPRLRLKESLDEILATPYDKKKVVVSVESKVFAVGIESYTVGSNEFYQNYAAKSGVCCLLDNGHYHPLEYVSDKIPALLAFYDKVALHVTRGVRWDSDHVVLLEDELKEIAKEIVRNDATDKVMIGLDYFDASINRIAAWVVGARNMRKALLYALLQPNARMKELQDNAEFTELMWLNEEVKTLPFGEAWAMYLESEKAVGAEWLEQVKKYESKILGERK